MKKYYTNVKTGKVTPLRYLWALRYYRASTRKLKFSLHVIPPALESANYSIYDYEELAELCKKWTSMSPRFITEEDNLVNVVFDKEATTENFLAITEIIMKDLEVLGIENNGVVGLESGSPSLEYAKDYIENTTSIDLSVTDIVRHLCQGNTANIKRAFERIPVMSEQDFDPDKDTNQAYLKQIMIDMTNNMLRDIAETLAPNGAIAVEPVESPAEIHKFFDALASALGKSERKRSPKKKSEGFTTETSEEYSDFQSHWI